MQTFDPVKHYVANKARFQNNVNLCLATKLKTIHSKRMKDALFRPGNLSLGEQMGGEDLSTVDDEFCHSHPEYLRRAANASEKQSDCTPFLQRFVDVLRREDPNVLSRRHAPLPSGTR